MNRTHVIIILIVLALAVGVVVFVKPGTANAAATRPGLGSGYAGDAAGDGWYGEAPNLPAEQPAPVKPSFLSTSTGRTLALAAVASPVLVTGYAVQGAKAAFSGGKSLIKKLF